MSVKPKAYINEDWTVVILGFLIVIIALSGFVVPVPVFSWKSGTELIENIFSPNNLSLIGTQFGFAAIIALIGAFLTGRPIASFMSGFTIIFILTLVALILAGNSTMKGLNLEAVIFSLAIGLLIGNFFRLPEWFKAALGTEMFVKIGLVLLGTGIIFGDILKAGSLGLVQALMVVVSVWYFAYWLCQKLKVDKEMSMMISSAVSICGVSAAIATSGAIKGDSNKLSYVISLVLVTAIPMMIFMPILAQLIGLSEAETGAWLGGSIDTTGAVVASGSIVGEVALNISTIVKLSQNVLLGLAAFAISVYWAYSKTASEENKKERPTLRVIWERFPKFVLGFIATSLVFSFLISADTVKVVKEGLKNFYGLWFALGFTSIGLETNFKDLFQKSSRRPLFAFLIAQLFNIIVTLFIAVLLFD